jgi:predicted Zn-dependent peptidase
MFDYGTYGVKSPYKNIYSAKELENIKPADVISFIKKLTSYRHEVIYYGSKEIDEVKDILKNGHIIPEELTPVPKAIDFTALDNKENVIYVVNYKDMKQAEIVMLSKGVNFEKSLSPVTRLYNEYFGSIIFQELRESKALAYSVYSSYSQPVYAKDPYILMSYIGTQTDKIDEAFSGFYGLLNDLPKSEVTFNASKKGVLELIQTDRITKANIIFRYLALRKLGIDYDLRKDNYEKISNFSFDDIKIFATEFIKDKKYTILVLADKEKLDLTILKKYGRIEFLEMDKIFGY